MNVKNYLLSFMVDAKDCEKFAVPDSHILIDSGAFTAWRSGEPVDIEAYKQFALLRSQDWIYVNLDVIPQTNSTPAQIAKCAEEGFENFLYLKKHIKNVLPVYHYGEDIKWLYRYLDYTDYIGLAPDKNTHEAVKREFLRMVFKRIGTKYRTHGLGYSSFEGLALFPFYSVDSISFKKVHIFVDGKKENFWANSAMDFFFRKRVQSFLNLEQNITALWESRGVKW